MADDFEDEQQELAQLWKKARKDGCMSPWQQAKAFGLKEAWEELHGEKTYGKIAWITERVYVQGQPPKHPSNEAVRKLLLKMADDEDWFPGKVYGSVGGRPAQVPEIHHRSHMNFHRSARCLFNSFRISFTPFYAFS